MTCWITTSTGYPTRVHF